MFHIILNNIVINTSCRNRINTHVANKSFCESENLKFFPEKEKIISIV